MKPQLTLVALFLFLGTLTAQVRFKVKLLSDNQTYQVILRPETDWANPLSTTTGGQVTMRVPVGGFSPGTITNIKGVWKLINTVVSPTEAPGFVYYIYGLDTPIAGSQITYTNGVEIPVFSYKNVGTCTGPVEIISNITDPFLEPNSQNLGIKNYLTVLGAGQGVDAYIGNYTTFPADCTPISNCGIEVYDVALVSPSACGVADGKITIDAVHQSGIPLQYTITYGNTPVIWQSGNTFSNLAAGNTFYIAVRDVIGNCFVNLGAFELDGPLAAIIQNVDLNNPDCGGTNGSIVIHAISANGGTLQYAMSASGPWQASNTFSGLAEGTYTFYVRDITNNCYNPVGTYDLVGCVPPSCILTYDMNDLGNGKYEVTMLTDTTWNAPLNATSNLQVTIKVPTGGFIPSNVEDETPGVDFEISEIITAPIEDPDYDYITFSLQSATTGIPYVDGGTVHLFTFENTGSCVGDSIRFMLEDDPFTQPNSQNSTAGQYISVLGYGSADAPICLAKNAEICDAVPPVAPTCLVTYEVEKLAGDVFQVSIISDTTWTGPLNNFTSSAQVTLKVPTGGFVVGSLTSLQGSWAVGPPDQAPSEEPTSDYLTFYLANPTNLDVFQAGVKVPVFTFKNEGTCQNGQVVLMADDDPFMPPNSLNSNVGQYISPAGSQGETVTICLSNLPADDCSNDPCAGLQPNFGPLEACEGTSFVFQDSTISTNDAVTSWSWDFGDNSAVSASQSPSHTYSSSGNFEVSLTVTTQGGCSATYMDFVTVFPSPGDAPVSSYDICNGLSVTLETPANITSAVWSPTTGLDITDPLNPIASPTATTVYTLTATNSYGCVNTSQVTVNVLTKPVISSVNVTPISDCNKSDASIQITATAAGGIEYGIDTGSGITWQAGSTFANLQAGTYSVYVRNADGSCEAAYNGNQIVIAAPTAPAITNVASTPPNGCDNDGTITITATGGQPPLQYSIGGAFQASGSFTGLGAGTYNIIVQNSNGSCGVTANPVVFTQPVPPTITPIADQSICVGSSINITAQLSASFVSYSITGTGQYSGDTIVGNKLKFVATANAVGTTTYNVTLTRANGCSATTSFNLTANAVPTADFTISPIICKNGEVVLHNSSTNPTNVLTWSLAGAQVVSASTQNSTSPDSATMVVKWGSVGTKTITLSVNNGGCIATTSQSITVAAFNPDATFDNTSPSCGLSNGAIDLTVNNSGYTFAWSNGKTTEDISNLAAGPYKVTITDPTSQCMATASTTLTGTPALTISGTSVVPPTQCTGANGDGSLTAVISGGTAPFTYSITGVTPVNSPLPTVTFNNIAAGTYILNVSDAVGCTAVKTVVVNSVSSQLNVTMNVVDAGCTSNNGSVSATVAGGSGTYTYSLLVNNQLDVSDQPVTGSTVSLNGLAPNTYLIIFEDVNGCIAAGAGTVERMAGTFPATALITPASCGSSNGAIQLNGIPAGATLAWSIGGNTNPLTDLQAGVYSATITESNGCMSDSNFVVNTTGGQVVTLGGTVGATCGLANGSITFTVTGGGQYSYKLLGAPTVPGGFGTPDIPTTITDVPKGSYVLEITDLLQANCKVYQVVTVSGSDVFQINSTVSFATSCGNHNGKICMEIAGGQLPYTVVASEGTIVPGNSPNEFCVTGLYEGIVTVTVTGAGGCQKVFTEDMGNLYNEPTITIDSVQVTPATCPDDNGSIVSNSTAEYDIFDTNGTFMGHTPWMAAAPGYYNLELTIGDCTGTLDSVYVGGPDAWSVIPTIVHEGCTTLGSISLNIAGGTGPYSVDWSNGETTTTISNLSAGTYTASISDDNNCQFIADFEVADSCAVSPCANEDVFYLDLYSQNIMAPETEICLPTNESNLDDYKLTLDNLLYDRPLGDCADETNFYDGFDVLPSPGPYTLERWDYGNEKAPNFTFTTLEDLVAKMRIIDASGNWVLDGSTIFGGNPTKVYGNMIVKHIASGFSLDLSPSKLSIPHPSIFVDNHSQVHVLISESPNGCLDTLFINLIQPGPPASDTIFIEVAEGEIETVCIPVDELYGVPEFLTNIALSFTNNAQINSTSTTCVEVIGTDEGTDEAAIVICDDLGVCDTTYILINVVKGGNDIEVYTGFSPNGDGVNDFFRIRNIDKYPNNDIKIYNRWGKQVFATKGYHNNWRADYRGQRLPDGSYFYFLNVEVNGVEKEYKGFVEVRR
ncbi:MAG: T9SS type B sorting domain-containing protein [Bacteroidetes bacterium]|nr:T9SS type B sorting domain-containing protein [Bacteroidota bacterium]